MGYTDLCFPFVLVFQITTGENFNEVLFACMKGGGWASGVIYCFLVYFLCHTIVLSVLISLLMENFQNDDEDDEDEEDEESDEEDDEEEVEERSSECLVVLPSSLAAASSSNRPEQKDAKAPDEGKQQIKQHHKKAAGKKLRLEQKRGDSFSQLVGALIPWDVWLKNVSNFFIRSIRFLLIAVHRLCCSCNLRPAFSGCCCSSSESSSATSASSSSCCTCCGNPCSRDTTECCWSNRLRSCLCCCRRSSATVIPIVPGTVTPRPQRARYIHSFLPSSSVFVLI